MDYATKPLGSVSVNQENAGTGVDLTGQVLGDYKVVRRLGQGGMGQVYLAEQISLKRHVALKLLKSELAASSTALVRFKTEAEAVARATHANIVQVYAIHEISGHHVMVLEYVEGRNLREYLEKKGPPEILLGLSIMRQVAAALQRASELGIIHRDIKPENILLTRKGEVKVADFGLSRIFSESGGQAPNLTQSHVTMGTPLYMSPEQVEGKKNIDHRSDIYSFGVTCYHMFAGHPPFKGTTPFDVALQHVQKEPRPLGEIRPDLPPGLCAIIHKMMAKAPADRYQLGREILRDVARLRDVLMGASQTVPAPALAPSSAPQTLQAVSTLAVPRRQPPYWSRRLLFAALPLALGIGLAVAWSRNHPITGSEAGTLQDNPGATAKILFSPQVKLVAKEREEELLKRIEEHDVKPLTNLKLASGLEASLELGLVYLKDPERLGDAEIFFKRLTAKPNFQYKTLGKIGSAMVLAFRDQPEESNERFLEVLGKDKAEKEKWNPFWVNAPLREIMAKALNDNLVNSPGTFPERLKPYLHPPPPTLKTSAP